MVWPDSSVASEITRLDSEITSPVLSQAKLSTTGVTPSVKNSSLRYPPFVIDSAGSGFNVAQEAFVTLNVGQMGQDVLDVSQSK
jgi:hypothetical protein